MPSTYIQRTPSGGNRKKWTWSAWIKLSDVTAGNRYPFSAYVGSNNTGYFASYLHTDSKLTLQGWNIQFLKTTRVFRDPTAWYHIVIVMDTAQATAANRLKIYVNGLEETAFDTDNRSSISQDSDMGYNSNGIHTIGGYQSSGSANAGFDGIMSHVHFTDGYAYTPSAFGETDAATGEWKINTTPSVSYGTTGYWIFKDDAGVTDQSPNSNNWTASGTLTSTKDCPSNIFATLNSLNVPTSNAPTFSLGNTKTITMNTDPGYFGGTSTLGASSGKYYAEIKITDNNGVGAVGITFDPAEKARQGTTFSAQISDSFVYANNAKQYSSATGTSGSSYGNTYTDGDIIGIAMDLDNSKLYFSKNGTFQNSGVPTSGSTGTGAISITAGKTYFFYLTDVGGALATYECNFGNGYFGTTAVSSAGTNASNNGVFEYDVPAGYTALSTKGLNE